MWVFLGLFFTGPGLTLSAQRAELLRPQGYKARQVSLTYSFSNKRTLCKGRGFI
jgi:hypothetical protein